MGRRKVCLLSRSLALGQINQAGYVKLRRLLGSARSAYWRFLVNTLSLSGVI